MIPIASRNLTAPDGRAVTLSVFAPEVHEGGWRCGVRVVIDGAQTLEYAEGIDAFQALSLGLFQVWRQAGELGAIAEGHAAGVHGFYRIELGADEGERLNAEQTAKLSALMKDSRT